MKDRLLKTMSKRQISGLYTIADNTFRPELSHVELAEAFLRGGAKVVQLRVKKSSVVSPSKLLAGRRQSSEGIMKLKSRYDFTFIINDYVEIAKEVGVDGVHVGREDMPIAEVRKIVGNKMIIGSSSHSLLEALAAEKAGADYVACGAIFKTKSKGQGHPVQGLEKLREVVCALRVPVVAIGGIGRNNLHNVLETGVASVAMITALTEADDIAEATRYFYEVCLNHRRL